MEMSFVTIKARIAEDERDRRRSSRLPVDLEATVRELGASGVEARVLNISESGFMAVAEGHFEVGTRVWLMLPGRERANAVVKWTAGDKLGAEFAEPISLDGLAAPDASARSGAEPRLGLRLLCAPHQRHAWLVQPASGLARWARRKEGSRCRRP